jgi:hypothetical protein
VAHTPTAATPEPKTRVLDADDWPAQGTVLCEHAGLFLLVPELVALDLPGLVAAAGYPGTSQLGALHWVLALLALKLSGRRRRSHVQDVVHDHALGLFAGLTVLPKTWHLTTYSYRTERRHQQQLFEALQPRLRAAGLLGGESFNLDFHAMRASARARSSKSTTFRAARSAPARCSRSSPRTASSTRSSTPTPTSR